MARMKLSAIFTSLQGRFGGGVFRNHRGTTTLASSGRPHTNLYTQHQVDTRARLGFLSKRWKLLTCEQRDAWGGVAIALSDRWGNYENEVGSHTVIRTPRGPYTAIDAFISANSLRYTADLVGMHNVLSDAPLGAGPPSSPIITSIEALGFTVKVNFNPFIDWGENADIGRFRIFVKSGDSAVYPQLARSQGGTAGTSFLNSLRRKGSRTLVQPGKGVFFVQIDAVNLQGQVSAPSNVSSDRKT